MTIGRISSDGSIPSSHWWRFFNGLIKCLPSPFAIVCLAFFCCALPMTAKADIVPPKSYTTTPSGLNIADGSFVYSVTDLSMGGLELQRYHRTGNIQPNNPMFGTNFSSNFDIFISTAPLTQTNTSIYYLTVHMGNTAIGRFSRVYNSNSVYADNLDAERGIVTWDGSRYTFTNSNGDVYTFSATVVSSGTTNGYQRKIESIVFADGRRQDFYYDSSGFLKLVDDSSGYAIAFDKGALDDVAAACIFNRSAAFVSVTSNCTGATIKVAYGYTTISTKAYLASVTDVLGGITSYGNTIYGINCLTPPGFSSCKMSFTLSGTRVINQTLLDGGTWSTSGDNSAYTKNDDYYMVCDGCNEASATDPLGNTYFVNFTKTSPMSMADPLNRASTFQYLGGMSYFSTDPLLHDGSLLMQATTPEGNTYLAEYNGPALALTKETLKTKTGGVEADLVKQYGYAGTTYQNATKPIWIRDPKGAQSDFTYAAHGGILSEMAPAPTASAARPLKLTTWVQRYAMLKNSAGTLVQAASPIWLTATETQCQTLSGTSPAATCDPAAQQTLTTYEYGATGTAESLLVKGVAVTSSGVTLRTCYGYDQYARKISETKPNANFSSCP